MINKNTGLPLGRVTNDNHNPGQKSMGKHPVLSKMQNKPSIAQADWPEMFYQGEHSGLEGYWICDRI